MATTTIEKEAARMSRAVTHSSRPRGFSRRLHVACDLRYQRSVALEHLLAAQQLPELHHQALAVEVAREVDQMNLDATLPATEVDVDADRDGGAMSFGQAGVDAVLRNELVRGEYQVGGRKAEPSTARQARDDPPVELVG